MPDLPLSEVRARLVLLRFCPVTGSWELAWPRIVAAQYRQVVRPHLKAPPHQLMLRKLYSLAHVVGHPHQEVHPLLLGRPVLQVLAARPSTRKKTKGPYSSETTRSPIESEENPSQKANPVRQKTVTGVGFGKRCASGLMLGLQGGSLAGLFSSFGQVASPARASRAACCTCV